jgi:flagellar basal body-associated protein FliL
MMDRAGPSCIPPRIGDLAMPGAQRHPEPQEQAPEKKKAPVKIVGIIAGLMVAEAVGVFLLVGMTTRPQSAIAEIHGAEQGDQQQSVEIVLIEDKFQNLQSGRVWIWDMQIVLKVRKRNQPHIDSELEKRSAEIREGVSQIIRRAQHAHLREPDLVTINRQLTAYLDKALGPDPEGRSRIERVLIPRCKGFQIEN